MLAFYRSLLHLYPATYRSEFGEEMMEVLSEVQARACKRSALTRVSSAAREASGLMYGALQEHFRSITGSQDRRIFSSMFSPMFISRRFAMRSEFRFPKATVGLMTVILAAVVFTIEKAKAVSESIPHANPLVGPIRSAQFTIVPSLLVTMAVAGVAGVIGWAILFALRRSGVQRISEVNVSASQHSSK